MWRQAEDVAGTSKFLTLKAGKRKTAACSWDRGPVMVMRSRLSGVHHVAMKRLTPGCVPSYDKKVETPGCTSSRPALSCGGEFDSRVYCDAKAAFSGHPHTGPSVSGQQLERSVERHWCNTQPISIHHRLNNYRLWLILEE